MAEVDNFEMVQLLPDLRKLIAQAQVIERRLPDISQALGKVAEAAKTLQDVLTEVSNA